MGSLFVVVLVLYFMLRDKSKRKPGGNAPSGGHGESIL
jgi:hypothetical protein